MFGDIERRFSLLGKDVKVLQQQSAEQSEDFEQPTFEEQEPELSQEVRASEDQAASKEDDYTSIFSLRTEDERESSSETFVHERRSTLAFRTEAQEQPESRPESILKIVDGYILH